MYSDLKVVIFASFLLSANAVASTNQETCLAKTIYHESRGTSISEQRDIAKLVINRTKHDKFPHTICEVIYQKGQFKWVKDKLQVKDKVAWENSISVAKEIIQHPEISMLPNDVVFFKTKTSRNYLTDNLRLVRIKDKREHNFFAIRG